jgi:hypothetical protein
LSGRPARTAGPTAKHISETEKIAEDILNATEPRRSPPGTSSAGDSLVAESVISLALFAVGKDRVCFGGLLEFLLSLGIAGVLVWVKFYREPSVSALYLLL